MSLLVYRDRDGKRDLLGKIDGEFQNASSFAYDPSYLERARAAGELGISERLPLDAMPYSLAEIAPFFSGLLPEGEVYESLIAFYQIPRPDYLGMIGQMGCESIGALTFASDQVDAKEYEPRCDSVTPDVLAAMREDPLRAAVSTASSTRLSLAGAQCKIAWCLKNGADASEASCSDWLIPRGTAPSTHIVKISRHGEEEIALNELACSLLSQSCGIETAKIYRLQDIPGAICVERYDRVRSNDDAFQGVIRLHQEDFCQALGFSPFYKYQPRGVEVSYPRLASNLIESASVNPFEDKIEFAKRLVFNYAIGNTDAHLKNYSLLYNQAWTGRRLAPQYDVTCIPLTGYSTLMPFDVGAHRAIESIDEQDILSLAIDLDVNLELFDQSVRVVLASLESPSLKLCEPSVAGMADRIIDNAAPRIRVLRRFLG